MSCAGRATSSEKVAEILKTLREDSQIDFVTGNMLCTFLSDPLCTFQILGSGSEDRGGGDNSI